MSQSSHAGRQLAIFGEMLAWILPAARREPRFPVLLQQLLARDRRFGSRDRRVYRELAYTAVRFLPRLEAAPESERAALALAFAPDVPELRPLRGDGNAPAQIGHTNDADLFPEWFATECPLLTDGPPRAALHTRPPLWLRAQRVERPALEQFLADEGLPYRASDVLPGAIAVLRETDLTKTDEYSRGLFEIQDLGSQLILALAAPAVGERWLDACAGAGGKTLQLAQLVGASGLVAATDIRAEALAELSQRALRAGLKNIAVVSDAAKLAASYDGVLVDAPCSGSGTWRRSPHLKWQTRAVDLVRHADRQLQILSAQASRVRGGGRLVYATCSLARRENEGVIERFLASNPTFAVALPGETHGGVRSEHGITLLPHVHDTDGFFVSVLRRNA